MIQEKIIKILLYLGLIVSIFIFGFVKGVEYNQNKTDSKALSKLSEMVSDYQERSIAYEQEKIKFEKERQVILNNNKKLQKEVKILLDQKKEYKEWQIEEDLFNKLNEGLK